MKVTTNFHKHASSKTFFTISQGGARSGKTYAILQLLIKICEQNKNMGLIITVVRGTYGGAKAGPVVDFEKILTASGLWDWKQWNRTELTYRLWGNKIEFIGADKPEKWRGPQRDFLFINECNNLSWTTAWELIVRTNYGVYLDYNPTEEFWVHRDIMQNSAQSGKWTFIKSTVFDNELCPPEIRENILARAKIDPMYRRVFLEGEIGIAQGLVYEHWEIIGEWPERFENRVRGMDFGFTNDPTAIVDIGINREAFYADELVYANGLHNPEIAQHLVGIQTPVIADSAEPKSISEIQRRGIPIIGVKKGPGSLLWGINLLKSRKLFVTERSHNLIRELRSYKWLTDRDGKPLNVPIDRNNHALDALRYGIMWNVGLKLDKKIYIPQNVPMSGML